jgi:ATP-dependent DNA ligase
VEFYEHIISDPRGLPYSEGIVLKPIGEAAGGRWLKVKNRDCEDLIVVSVSDSLPGTKYHDSVAVMVVEDPRSGGRGEVGSFAISDAERQWIWDHREELVGAVAKVQVMAMTDFGRPRAGTFVGWHPDPRYGGIGSEMALQMYSESLAGMDKEESQRMLYRLKSSAGGRRA